MLHVEGMENLPSGGAILVANHQSIVDIPMLLSAFPRPVRFLAKRELGEIPLFGKAMAAAGNLFIDRDDPRDAVRMLRDVGARLRDGRLVVIFPEGTRSGDGSIGPRANPWAVITSIVPLVKPPGAPGIVTMTRSPGRNGKRSVCPRTYASPLALVVGNRYFVVVAVETATLSPASRNRGSCVPCDGVGYTAIWH